MLLKADKNNLRQKRHLRVRNHIHGTAERPRLNVYEDDNKFYVQIIDDEKGVTLTSAGTFDKVFEWLDGKLAAQVVGVVIAKKALAAGITEVVLDCDGIYSITSNVRHLLIAAREGGLKF